MSKYKELNADELLDDLDSELIEDTSLYDGGSDNTESGDPETTLEFDTLLITPSQSMKGIPIVNRELLSTKLDTKDITNIIHYDKIIQKYNLMQHIQYQKRKNFNRNLKDKINRLKLLGESFKIIDREFTLKNIGYERVIKVMVASTKAREGFTLDKIKTNVNITKEERKESTQEILPISPNIEKKKGFFNKR